MSTSNLSREQVKKIAESFDLSLTSFQHIDEAFLTKVFLVNDSYILRAKEEDTPEAERERLTLLSEVRTRTNLQLPQFRRALTGEFFVNEFGFNWLLYPIIPGKMVCSWSNLEEASDDFTKSALSSLKSLHDDTTNISANTQLLFSLTQEIESALNKDWGIPKKCREKIRGSLQRTRDLERNLAATEKCFIHGDFHHGNLVVNTANTIVGAIDLDWCRVGNRLEDLAYTIMMLMRFYTSDRFVFDQKYFLKLLSWYDFDTKDANALNDYLILCAFFDVTVLAEVTPSEEQKHYLSYQKSLLDCFCEIFSS